MKDKHGNKIKIGTTIQFDDDYFGRGLQREVKVTKEGKLGFEAVLNVSKELSYVEDWLDEIEVVTADTENRTEGKYIGLTVNRYIN